MWLQMLYILIPSAMLGIPVLGHQVSKFARRNGGEGPLAIEESPKSGNAKREIKREAAAALETAQVRSTSEYGDQRFRSSLETLEQRVLENSTRNIYRFLLELLEELRALDDKLRISGATQQARLTYAKYAPLVSKITEISASNVYGDFVRNPDHWKDPQRNRLQVELAVVALAKEVSGDIRRLNSSQELNFQVSVESIIGKAASAPQSADPDDAVTDLLGIGDGISMDELTGDIESLKAAVSFEAAELATKREGELRAKELEAEQKELEARKFRGGSKSDLEFQDESAVRPKLISRELFKQTFTIYGPGDNSSNFLVSYSNSITGESVWKKFSAVYEAAEWVDTRILAEEKKHDFKCNCVYCRPN